MSGLILKLAPKERVLINGAVIENGDRRGRISIVTPEAHILRLRDAIHPEDATTPVRRLCYAVQLVLCGHQSPEDAKHQLLRGLEQLSQVFCDNDSRRLLGRASESLTGGDHYGMLKNLRSLLPREARLLAAAGE